MEAAAPNYLPDNLANELSVKDDKFMSSFRAARRRCIEERGWTIDTEADARNEGKKSRSSRRPSGVSAPTSIG